MVRFLTVLEIGIIFIPVFLGQGEYPLLNTLNTVTQQGFQSSGNKRKLCSPEVGEGRRNKRHHWFSHWEELAVQKRILSCLLQWWLKHSVVSAYPWFVSAKSQLAASCQILQMKPAKSSLKNVALNIINDAAFCCGNVSWKGCSKTSSIICRGEVEGPGRGGGWRGGYFSQTFFFLEAGESFHVVVWGGGQNGEGAGGGERNLIVFSD